MKPSLWLRLLAVPAFAAVLGQPCGADPKIMKGTGPLPPVEIAATYSISLNGFDLGSLSFRARMAAGTYTADSDVSLSALLGAFKWHGVTRVSGVLAGRATQPQGYSFTFDGTLRSGAVRMAFTGNEITTLTSEPATVSGPDTVPLERQHLKNALDPLSAILTLARPEGENPCGRRLAIFDGKQRFDLTLIERRREALRGATKGGEQPALIVCRIKYTPISGYRDTSETRSLAESNGIEIAFRHVASAGLMVPHRVVIPTMAGDAVIEAAKVDVETQTDGALALVD
ncbi:MAG: DUF3108 domain-containing protein [Hyphomicrobium sp.]